MVLAEELAGGGGEILPVGDRRPGQPRGVQAAPGAQQHQVTAVRPTARGPPRRAGCRRTSAGRGTARLLCPSRATPQAARPPRRRAPPRPASRRAWRPGPPPGPASSSAPPAASARGRRTAGPRSPARPGRPRPAGRRGRAAAPAQYRRAAAVVRMVPGVPLPSSSAASTSSRLRGARRQQVGVVHGRASTRSSAAGGSATAGRAPGSLFPPAREVLAVLVAGQFRARDHRAGQRQREWVVAELARPGRSHPGAGRGRW